MFYFFIIIISTFFKVIHNSEIECGCNVNRNSHVNLKTNFYNELSSNQCPIDIKHGNTLNTHSVSSKMILIPSGTYQVGTDEILIDTDNEGPKKFVQLKSFYLDKYEVSNRDFTIFTESTDYKTEAETFGDSFVFTLFLNNTFKKQLHDFRVMQAPWWYKVYGTNWKHPLGPDSDVAG